MPVAKRKQTVRKVRATRKLAKPAIDLRQENAALKRELAQALEQQTAMARDLKESREYQAATSDVLKVISRSSTNIETVLDTLVETMARLCRADQAAMFRRREDAYHLVASHGISEEAKAFFRTHPLAPDRGTLSGRVTLERGAVHIPDVLQDSEYAYREGQKITGYQTMLGVPLLRGETLIGVLNAHRKRVEPFTNKEIELVATFAAQAVIAMENARLLNELRQRTDDLSESLQQQTATADVLKVISRSTFDLQGVLNTLVEFAVTLSGGSLGTIFQRRGELFHLTAAHGYTPEMLAYGRANPLAPGPSSNVGRAAMTGTVVQIPDVMADPDYTALGYQRVGNFRAMLGIPIMREAKVEGVFSLAKPEPGLFGPRQVELVQTFADQAVIAIENTRLFNETREALAQQTATSEVLQVISNSVADTAPVFEKILDNCENLFATEQLGIFLVRPDGQTHVGAWRGAAFEALIHTFPQPVEQTATWLAIKNRGVLYIPDTATMPDVPPAARAVKDRVGDFSIAWAPMLGEEGGVGSIAVMRQPPSPFTEKELALLKTFADQAVIAIQNARMFEQVQVRTKELSQSLDDLRTAQDRLIQTEKLASLGQLTAGIAHEIKNPLNFVNNFSALSAELIDELDETLAPAPLDQKMRGDVGELTQMLKSNLEKVVTHGRRANFIVKNMLLHSREGSGEHRSADINALVEESLNLAYHGARAEKPGFNVTLKRDLDPDAGAVELYPQEITRALLNLISNGFYAASQRESVEGETFVPVLIAATKNLGKTVEIRIRDNGTGIPPDVKQKIFNPFFTTKPSGEGTGLGLSMSHDIIVKQHGGSIDVETEPGLFTEFKIVLPRTSQR